jgi:hypothetical protein
MPAKILGKAPVEKPAKNRNNIKGALALTGFGDATLIENKHICKNSHCCYCACFYFKNLSVWISAQMPITIGKDYPKLPAKLHTTATVASPASASLCSVSQLEKKIIFVFHRPRKTSQEQTLLMPCASLWQRFANVKWQVYSKTICKNTCDSNNGWNWLPMGCNTSRIVY